MRQFHHLTCGAFGGGRAGGFVITPFSMHYRSALR
jgi:hypothetical protein